MPSSTTPELYIETDIAGFTPSQAQIDALARRLMPEIKKFFANEQIQKEFASWQEEHTTAKISA